jgi:hypothetical protein
VERGWLDTPRRGGRAGAGATSYGLLFVGTTLFTQPRGRGQPVEKVGAELKVARNQAPEAPKSPQYGVLGARSGTEAGIEGVFQQCTMALAEPPRSHENGSVASAIFTPGWGFLRRSFAGSCITPVLCGRYGTFPTSRSIQGDATCCGGA